MPDADATLTKRLHISGLTPALTPADLSTRLSTFGTVKAVDGFGLRDGLDQPRKFGYVTLETTAGKLARCLNLLSGSTWKGAKLRIGEAKPDFMERLAKERQAALDEPPRKKRKRSGGAHADDMSLVTPENVVGRGGWKVTPMGRIVRPVKMRPEHPMPPMEEDLSKTTSKAKTKAAKFPKKHTGDGKDGDGETKKRKRVKDPDVRARRRTIDVTRWGSVHLKGMFLDMDVVGTKVDIDMGVAAAATVESDIVNDDDSEDSEMIEEIEVQPPAPSPLRHAPTVPTLAPTPVLVPPPVVKVLPDNNTDVQLEKAQSLNLLASLFGGKDEDDWVGRESVGSDIDEEELAKGQGMMIDDQNEDVGFEIVPMDPTQRVPIEAGGSDDGMEVEAVAAGSPTSAPSPPKQKQKQVTKLKDLFAPREDDAGFSLLGHLDLDLELDDEVPFSTTQPTHAEQDYSPPPTTTTTTATTTTTTAPGTHTQSHTHTYTSIPTYPTPQINPKHPFFFPLPPSLTSLQNAKAHPPDLFELARERGWSWSDTGAGFFREGTEEDVRAAWEEGKSELTKGWRKRWREAGKVGRRSGRGRGRDAGDLGE
ncbi:hypothetical protein BDZ94DRAFT_1300909 [Collybia nuda]|uniref:RRM domain-containing protein n=1 Tax=Collybia nuda TaxID=64659 RepID=A0A9P6CAW3_9AGAR|nr:hypothetical protein BDZ94DRAFT_1300909 [Collybia nuda]